MTITAAMFTPLVDAVTAAAPVLLGVSLSILAITGIYSFVERKARKAVR